MDTNMEVQNKYPFRKHSRYILLGTSPDFKVGLLKGQLHPAGSLFSRHSWLSFHVKLVIFLLCLLPSLLLLTNSRWSYYDLLSRFRISRSRLSTSRLSRSGLCTLLPRLCLIIMNKGRVVFTDTRCWNQNLKSRREEEVLCNGMSHPFQMSEKPHKTDMG